MIQTLAPGHYRDTVSLTDFLVGGDLVWVGEAFTLRVTGWSMFPALRRGDILRLLPPDSVKAGDLVLFRQDRTLVCHRVIAEVSGDAVRTRGDDVTGDGEVVRRADLVGKVEEIVRGDTSIDPRAPQAATIFARVGRSVERAMVEGMERAVEVVSRFLRAFLGNSLVRPAVRLLLARSLSYAVGVPAAVRMVQAYRFVELGRRPLDRRATGATLRSLPCLREAIVVARLGAVPLGTMAVSSGEIQVRRAGAGLGIEENLRELVSELAALDSPLVG